MFECFIIQFVFVILFVSLHGRWGPLAMRNTCVAAPLKISTKGELILRTFICFFQHCPTFPTWPHFTNSSSKNDRAIAPSLTLTHPERCAFKLCARKYQKWTRIFYLGSNLDEKVVKQILQTWLQSPVLGVLVLGMGPIYTCIYVLCTRISIFKFQRLRLMPPTQSWQS